MKNNYWRIWIILAIFVVGTFLRTYQLHNWLDFGSDQVNDAVRVGDVVTGKTAWPLLGPDMSKSGTGGRSTRFHIGPIYYYFEIISAKIFGNYPDKMAYPDLLFTVLSLPLFYFFIRKLFSLNIAIMLTGIFAVSFYALKFSHSAWNPNSIPFFSLLFLLSLWEFAKNKKNNWLWVGILGIALGVGVQLHAILLVLLPATVFFIFILSLKKNWKILGKWLVVFLIAFVLNLGQIIHEQQTNFSNTKIFFISIFGHSSGGDANFLNKFGDDVDCHIEGNVYMLSAFGDTECNFYYMKMLTQTVSLVKNKIDYTPLFLLQVSLSLLFSFFGYKLLIEHFRKESNREKKYLWGIITLYITLSFFVFLPVVNSNYRYFVHIFFVPLIFFGLIVDFLYQKYPQDKKSSQVMIAIFLLWVIFYNGISIYEIVKQLATGTRSGNEEVVLGEMESIVNYLSDRAGSQRNIYFMELNRYSNFYKSIAYLSDKKGLHIERVKENKTTLDNRPLFYLGDNSKDSPNFSLPGYVILTHKDFGGVSIYQLQKIR
jgi:hypothetical protein